MYHQDHVRLLRPGIPNSRGVWADFGSGSGAFTLALAEIIGPSGRIYSIDQDRRALRQQQQSIYSRFPTYPPDSVQYLHADFTRKLDLSALDGIIMANSLHFYREKEPVLCLIKSYLCPGGRLILVEYNVDRGNRWVPFPISYSSWELLAKQVGFQNTQKLAAVPSHFLNEIYSAVSIQQGQIER